MNIPANVSLSLPTLMTFPSNFMNASLFNLPSYLSQFSNVFPDLENQLPWTIPGNLSQILVKKIQTLSPEYVIRGEAAIHRSAIIEEHVILKGPMIISEGCFIGAHAYLRGGVFLGHRSGIGPGCEVKSSVILSDSALAHFNFVGDSIVGSMVNMEAGSVIANHYNERSDKTIHVRVDGKRIRLDITKFGAIVGDRTKIGANSVLSPGTVLLPDSIVKRLELMEQ